MWLRWKEQNEEWTQGEKEQASDNKQTSELSWYKDTTSSRSLAQGADKYLLTDIGSISSVEEKEDKSFVKCKCTRIPPLKALHPKNQGENERMQGNVFVRAKAWSHRFECFPQL